MALKLTNNGIGRLAANVAIGDTTISLTPGDGAKFPVLGDGDWCPATIVRASDGAYEIVKVTARSSDTLTIERAKESTSAKAFVAGDRVELRQTAQIIIDNLTENATHAATSKATPVDADELPLVDSADGNKLKKLTWANLIAAVKAAVFSAWGALINGGTAKTTPVGADAIAIMDSEASNATKKLTFANLKTWLLSFLSANVASAATVDLTGSFGKTVHITGTTAISAFTMTAGQVIDLIFDGVLTLTHHATTNNLPGAANITTAAGDRARYLYDGTTIYCLQYQRANGKAVVETEQNTSVPVRQTVLSGPVDSSGYPSFGGSTGSATLTLSGTLKATCMAGGEANRIGSITNPAFTSPAGTGTGFLMLGIAADGAVTASVRTLAPIYQFGGTYSTTSGQLTCNIQEGIIKAGDGSTAAQVYEVCIGECAYTSGAWSGTPTYYAIQAKYISTDTAVPTFNTKTNFNHNIGCQFGVDAKVDLICQTTQFGWVAGEVSQNAKAYYNSGTYVVLQEPCGVDTRLASSVMTGATAGSFSVISKSTGAPSAITPANWKMRVSVKRGW